MKLTIKLENLNDVNAFISQANKINGDVTVYKGKYCVDGKSLMGLMSIGIPLNIIVEYPDDSIDFNNFIQKYEVRPE